MKTTARYLRIESWCDKALAWVIQLPPPLSAAVVLLWTACAFVAGLML